ncbi:MAG: inorganic pyrophosphatase [Marinifilaceae bacterium]
MSNNNYICVVQESTVDSGDTFFYNNKVKKTVDMGNKINDPIARLMGLRYKSHPWHGLEVGEETPEVLTAFIEMVPTDTVKYELDKVSGYIKIDRPQKYSNVVPALYGFIPQSYCGELVANYCMQQTGMKDILGDGDPLDICVLTERTISHGDIIAKVRPIGGFRMLDGNEADDKIIAVLKHDATYHGYNDISELPTVVVDRLKHYFLTYKDLPGAEGKSKVEITDVYGKEEAYEVIMRSLEDYKNHFAGLEDILKKV